MYVVDGSAAPRRIEAGSIDSLFALDARGSDRRKAYEASIEARIDEYERTASRLVGACIIEPVVQGAGGMRLVDPEFHRAMDAVCKARNIPVIADEVFSGLWRLGAESAAVDLLGIKVRALFCRVAVAVAVGGLPTAGRPTDHLRTYVRSSHYYCSYHCSQPAVDRLLRQAPHGRHRSAVPDAGDRGGTALRGDGGRSMAPAPSPSSPSLSLLPPPLPPARSFDLPTHRHHHHHHLLPVGL